MHLSEWHSARAVGGSHAQRRAYYAQLWCDADVELPIYLQGA